MGSARQLLQPSVMTSSSIRKYDELFSEVKRLSGVNQFDVFAIRDIDIERMSQLTALRRGRLSEVRRAGMAGAMGRGRQCGEGRSGCHSDCVHVLPAYLHPGSQHFVITDLLKTTFWSLPISTLPNRDRSR